MLQRLLLIFCLFIVFGIGWVVGNANAYTPPPLPTPTPIVRVNGVQIFDAVNSYRVSQGLSKVELTSEMCNDIGQRAVDIFENQSNTHNGFEEWANDSVRSGYSVGELLVLNYSIDLKANMAVDAWLNSPSHKLVLTNPKWEEGCSYVDNKVIVMELGAKVNK